MLDQVCQLARNAGDAIMQVYDGTKPMDVVSKADNSPVTAADIAAHTVIMDGLRTLTPEIPVLSEEDPPGWEVRQHWQRYWLVDPLDGTKEFIKRNGEFTVNIALIDHGKPILGVVYAPVMNVMYSAAEGKAWKEECGVCKQIQVRDAVIISSLFLANLQPVQSPRQGRLRHFVFRNALFLAQLLPGSFQSLLSPDPVNILRPLCCVSNNSDSVVRYLNNPCSHYSLFYLLGSRNAEFQYAFPDRQDHCLHMWKNPKFPIMGRNDQHFTVSIIKRMVTCDDLKPEC